MIHNYLWTQFGRMYAPSIAGIKLHIEIKIKNKKI